MYKRQDLERAFEIAAERRGVDARGEGRAAGGGVSEREAALMRRIAELEAKLA